MRNAFFILHSAFRIARNSKSDLMKPRFALTLFAVAALAAACGRAGARGRGAEPVRRGPRQRRLDARHLRHRRDRPRQVCVGARARAAAAARGVHPQVTVGRQARPRRSRSAAERLRRETAERPGRSVDESSTKRAATPSASARSCAAAQKPRPRRWSPTPSGRFSSRRRARCSRSASEAVDLSVAIASKLLQRNISKEDNERLIDEALRQIDGTRSH